MTHPGVGPVGSLAYVLTQGIGSGFPAAERWAAIWGWFRPRRPAASISSGWAP